MSAGKTVFVFHPATSANLALVELPSPGLAPIVSNLVTVAPGVPVGIPAGINAPSKNNSIVLPLLTIITLTQSVVLLNIFLTSVDIHPT